MKKIDLNKIGSYITKYTNNGVPILKDVVIEEITHIILTQYNNQYLVTPCEIQVIDILNYFSKNHGLTVLSDDLGYTGDYKIRGRIIFSRNTIYIDQMFYQLDELRPLLRFTIAHELGHWILHTTKQILLEESKENTSQIDDYEAIWDRKKLETPRDWIEHQANVFAGSLLMPAPTFHNAVKGKQREMGITHRLGTIYSDNQQNNVRDLRIIVAHLQGLFGVSKTAISIRLEQLNILYKDPIRFLQFWKSQYREKS